MSLHKLSAGSGYEYLTRQVAALDSTELGRASLADYYSAKGESPGRWVGSGLVGIDGIEAGDLVTAEQMRNLFGSGCDPVSGAALGRRYAVYGNDGVDGFNIEVARRLAEQTERRGGSVERGPALEAVAAMRTEVGREFFARQHGREPRDARELAGAIARYSRPRQSAVAGFDLTFSPVKSVSALWTVAPREVAEAIEAAHDAAVADALAFIEREVLFTREGADGARQVEVRGLIAAAFTHRDSRAGDPDLHTHVAVANKVQTRQGKWLAIYGRLLHEHVVAVSETYNTALERHLGEGLGLQFTERPGGRDRRPVREIVGVDAALCQAWSTRRADIVARQRELAREFQAAHGRPPSRAEQYALAEQANLETRQAKHEPRSLADQRRMWRAQAIDVLGSDAAVRQMVHQALHPEPVTRQQVSAAWIRAAAERVIEEVEARRATWRVWHLRAEAQRQVRDAEIPAERVAEVVEWIVDDTIERLSINLTPERDPVPEPVGLRRSDGTSVYRHSGRDHYTSQRVLDAEQRIIAAAGSPGSIAWSVQDVELALLAARVDGTVLNTGQERLVEDLATSGRQVQLALAPAGSGKTTAMRLLADVWRETHASVLGLAPSAAAAAALSEATGMPCETLAKLAHDLANTPDSALAGLIGPQSLVIIDEAGMADTLTLARVIDHAVAAGAVVRLVGDDHQLAAIGAGGVLRDITARYGAAHLDEVVRFADPTEAAASLALRGGDSAALGFYLDHDRVHVGDADGCLEAVLAGWQRERASGRDCLMLAPTRGLVRDLNQRARAARLADGVCGPEVALSDGTRASVGDVVITRRNDRRLAASATDWVKNGDRWTVTGIINGALTARHMQSGLRMMLPAEYVAEHVELGYASTVHTAQGVTADVMHGIVTGEEPRQVLYTVLTRGRIANHAHVVVAEDDGAEQLTLPGLVEELTAVETLERILARDGAAVSATSTASRASSPAQRLHDAATRYADALALAAQRVSGAAEEATRPGPLPWLSDLPDALREHEGWERYLSARARLVSELAEQVRAEALAHPPEWARRHQELLTPDLLGELAVWRASVGVKDDDRSLVGPTPSDDRGAAYRRKLLDRFEARLGEGLPEWEGRIIDLVGRRDEHTVALAEVLDRLARRGIDAQRVLTAAAASRPLPDEHGTAALAYRIRKLVRPTQLRQPDPAFRHRHIELARHPDPPRSAPGIGF